MRIRLYNNYSANNVINKTITQVLVINGSLKEDCSIYEPVVTIELSDTTVIPFINYARIDDFYRFYYVRNMTTLKNNLIQLELSLDVLNTYSYQILSLPAIIDKQESVQQANKLYDDNSLKVSCETATHIINFPTTRVEDGHTLPNGFSRQPRYVLMVAGARESI